MGGTQSAAVRLVLWRKCCSHAVFVCSHYEYTPGQVNGSVTVLKYQLSIISCRNIFQEMCNVTQKLIFGEAQVAQRGCENHRLYKTDSHPQTILCFVKCCVEIMTLAL